MDQWRHQGQDVRMARTALVVDDHDGFRASARRLLESAGFLVIGESADAAAAVADAARLQPDVVLLDIQLPDGDGFAVAERLSLHSPASLVVLTSSRERGDFGPRVSASGVRGFITKTELSGERICALVGAA